MKILSLAARQVLDSRGNPTVEVEARGIAGIARCMVPSGASTGVYEAKELRDGAKPWGGAGVTKAVHNVNLAIAKHVVGRDFATQEEFDTLLIALDGTADKSKLGANAILGASMVFTRLSAMQKGIPLYQHIADEYKTKPRLPVIFANVINGGKHSGNGLPMQEFMIVSQQRSFVSSVEDIAGCYHQLKKTISARYGPQATGVGDEGGFAPPVKTAEESLHLLREASKTCGRKLSFAIDAAASEFYNASTKLYAVPHPKNRDQLLSYYVDLIRSYGVVSLEDPFEQHAFADFAMLKQALAKHKPACQIVADDLTVSNPARVDQAIASGSANSLLLKVNQIGTVTEAVQAAQKAKAAGWTVMVSHRSGETDDAFISHLATGLGTGQIKIGAPCRGERVAKYNELLRISESCSRYARL